MSDKYRLINNLASRQVLTGIATLLIAIALVFPGDAWAKRTIYGQITGKDGKPLAGAQVKAYDSDKGKDGYMGSAKTDKNGNYRITYHKGAWDGKKTRFHTQWRPDIYVVIEAPEHKRFKSKTYRDHNLKHDLRINARLKYKASSMSASRQAKRKKSYRSSHEKWTRPGKGAQVQRSAKLSKERGKPGRKPQKVPRQGKAITQSHAGHPIDLNRYCRKKYGAPRAVIVNAVLLDSRDAYSWRCEKTRGASSDYRELVDISIVEACSVQYGPWAEAGLERRRDPYSWYCNLPPSTKVVLHLNRVYVDFNGDSVGKGELQFFFKVRHLSPKCSGKRYGSGYRECNEWAYDKKKKAKSGTKVEIDHFMPHVTLYNDDAFQVDWWAKEYDGLRLSDECGTQSNEGGAVIIPVRKTFTKADDWGIGHHDVTENNRQGKDIRYLICRRVAKFKPAFLLRLEFTISAVN